MQGCDTVPASLTYRTRDVFDLIANWEGGDDIDFGVVFLVGCRLFAGDAGLANEGQSALSPRTEPLHPPSCPRPSPSLGCDTLSFGHWG